MGIAFDQILKSPDFPETVEKLNRALAEEQARREAFLERITEQDKAEFINGEMVMHSPVRSSHNLASLNVATLMKVHVGHHRLGRVVHEKIMVSLTRNDYEPDVAFFSAKIAQAFTPDQMRFPAPDLVVEVLSPSTEAIDRGVKFEDYAHHGVAEYWIIDPDAETVEQYLLSNGVYRLNVKMKDGEIESPTLGGFRIPVRAIFDDAECHRALAAIIG